MTRRDDRVNQSAEVGTVSAAASDTLEVERSGMRHLLGFLDLAPGTIRALLVDAIVFGEPRRIGMRMIIDTTQ